MILQKINQSHLRYQLIPKYEEIIENDSVMESFYENFRNYFKIYNREELKSDSYWNELTSFLFDIRALIKYPLPLNYLEEKFEEIKEEYHDIESSHHECAVEINSIFKILQENINIYKNSYSEQINHFIAGKNLQSTFALFLPSGKSYRTFIDNYKDTIDKRIIVLNESSYRKSKMIFDYVLILGSLNFYASRDFLDPRFKNLILIRKNFIPTGNLNDLSFKDNIWDRNILNFHFEKNQIHKPSELTVIEDIKNEYEFMINYHTQNIESNFSDTHDTLLHANFCKLPEKYFCFLCNESGLDSSQETLLILENDKIKIKKKEIDEINAGDYVILRVGKSDNNLIELKTRDILKDNYNYLVDRRKVWKDKLQRYINLNTKEILKKNLKNIGLNPSNANLRNWLGANNQRIRDDHAFNSLLNLIGFSNEESQKISVEMTNFNNARTQAGRLIMNELKSKIIEDEDSIDELLNKGYEIYNFDGYEHRIGVFQIVQIQKEKTLKPSSMLDEAIEI